jgi:hypothetical protein
VRVLPLEGQASRMKPASIIAQYIQSLRDEAEAQNAGGKK